MASATLTSVADTFPVGTSVGAYPQSNWLTSQLPPSGAAQGSATATSAVAASGSLAFTGLADSTRYYAAASVSGTWKYRAFQTPDGTLTSTDFQFIEGSPGDGDIPAELTNGLFFEKDDDGNLAAVHVVKP